MELLFVYLGFNVFITIFGYNFWRMFPSDRLGYLRRQNDNLKTAKECELFENNNNHIETSGERKCK